MSAVLRGPTVSGSGGGTPFAQISPATHSKQVLESLEGRQRGDRTVPPGVAVVPGTCRCGGAWPRGAGGQRRAVADGGSWRRQSGGRDNGGIVRWRHGSAQHPVLAAGHCLAPLALREDTVVCPLSPWLTPQLHRVCRGGLVPQCHPPQQWVPGVRAPGSVAISPGRRRL